MMQETDFLPFRLRLSPRTVTKFLVDTQLFDEPVLVWDGDDTDASPDFTSITIDPRLPAGSYLYIDYKQGASVIETYKKALTQNEIDAIDPISLTGDDLPNGTYNAVPYHKNAAETEIISRIGAAEEVTVDVGAASSPTEVGYGTATFTSPDGVVSTFTIATTGLTAHAGGTFDIQDGDVLVLAINAVTSGALTPSVANETSVTWASEAVIFGDDNNDSNLVIARAAVSGTPPATFTITTSAAVNNSTAVILKVLRDYQNAWDVTPVTASGANDDAANPGAITPSTANALVGAIYAAANGAASGNTFVGLGPSTDWSNYIAVKATGGALRHALLAMQTRIWTSGAIDPPAIDPGISAATAHAWTASTFAIPPVA